MLHENNVQRKTPCGDPDLHSGTILAPFWYPLGSVLEKKAGAGSGLKKFMQKVMGPLKKLMLGDLGQALGVPKEHPKPSGPGPWTWTLDPQPLDSWTLDVDWS